MEKENEKPRDPVERIRRGLTGNFGKGSAELKLQYEGVSNNQNAQETEILPDLLRILHGLPEK